MSLMTQSYFLYIRSSLMVIIGEYDIYHFCCKNVNDENHVLQ